VIWYGVIEIADPGTVTGLTITYRGHNSSSVTQRLGVYNFAMWEQALAASPKKGAAG